MSAPFRGVFTIPSTPFDEQFEVDWKGVRRIVDFCVECGAHGIVWPVNASGFASLSDEERLKGARVVVEQVAGRVPVVIGTQGVCASHAAMFSRHANEIGADAVIAMAPYIQKVEDEDTLFSLFRLNMILKGILVLVLVLRARPPRKSVAFEHDYEDDNEEEIVSKSPEWNALEAGDLGKVGKWDQKKS